MNRMLSVEAGVWLLGSSGLEDLEGLGSEGYSWEYWPNVLWELVNVWRDWSQEGLPFARKWRSKGSEAAMCMVWLGFIWSLWLCSQSAFIGRLTYFWSTERSTGIQKTQMRTGMNILAERVLLRRTENLSDRHLVWYELPACTTW